MNLATAAACLGDLKLLHKSQEKDASSLTASDEHGDTCLISSVFSSQAAVVEYLLESGCDANVAGSEGQTPLMYFLGVLCFRVDPIFCSRCASFNGNLQLIQTLITANAAINTQDAFGMTAAMFAGSQGHIPILELLISEGANLEMKDGVLFFQQTNVHPPPCADVLRSRRPCCSEWEDCCAGACEVGTFHRNFEFKLVLLHHSLKRDKQFNKTKDITPYCQAVMTPILRMALRSRKAKEAKIVCTNQLLIDELKTTKSELRKKNGMSETASLQTKSLQLQVETLQQSLDAERKSNEKQGELIREMEARRLEEQRKLEAEVEGLRLQLKEKEMALETENTVGFF